MWVVPQNLQLGMPQALQPRHPYGSDPQSEHLWRKKELALESFPNHHLGSVIEVWPWQHPSGLGGFVGPGGSVGSGLLPPSTETSAETAQWSDASPYGTVLLSIHACKTGVPALAIT